MENLNQNERRKTMVTSNNSTDSGSITKGRSICLLNDSFPPLIDGVSNTVVNYADQLQKLGHKAIVITPDNPEAQDSNFTYPIRRYPSISTERFEGYPAGIPFSPHISRYIKKQNIDLIHTHCPVTSAVMARELQHITGVPIVFTYHTKFDVDIGHIFKSKPLQALAQKALLANISACDEVWAVSKGAGENLRAMGYDGEYIVMPNGVDLPLGKASTQIIASATAGYDLPFDIPVYLFVGRMMWYKGLRIIIDALTKLNAEGKNFRMVFIGSGDDREEIEAYAECCGISNKCIFTGAIHSRENLRGWYSRANLFLFPSTYDTNGLVVREAAACSLGSVLIQGSCAAEGVTDGRNGLLISENADSLAACLRNLTMEKMQKVGCAAARELYLSWEAAVSFAAERYETVIEHFQHTRKNHPRKALDRIVKINAEFMNALSSIPPIQKDN